ncbi:extracellular solute-binding protein [Sphingobacterium bovistauri]|uniref:Extracellular solute-binding protein n=1 Tax=Sphingobacterium bovistauri TaxID=2781959 RepID=A0ABS7Z3L5_9SPHI|nr:extracellular solute-binding protein [Sphingobacterium bovistauri]MCA5004732.1 extracellular solute-binding protein [Sphingobacterium bovistauri]
MDKLRFAVRKFGPFEDVLESLLNSYNELNKSAIDIEFVPMDLEELYSELIIKEGLKSGIWDLVHINTDWISKAHSQNSLHILNNFLEKNPVEDYKNAWSKSLLYFQNFDNDILALPFHDGPECLVYRKDLFQDPKEKENFQKQFKRPLKVPKTWDEFLQVASFFNRPEQNLFGTIFAGYPDGHNAVFDFCIQIWSRGGELLNNDGKVVVNSQIAVQALDFYRQLFNNENCLHSHSKSYDSVKAGNAFAQGEVAMMVNWFGFASWAQIDKDSAVKGNVDIASIPTMPGIKPISLNVYWLTAVATGSRNKDLAYDFLKYSIGKEQDKLLTLTGGVGCRFSTWYDEEINSKIPFYNKLGELHEIAKTLPKITNWPEIAHIIDNVVTESITQNEDSYLLLSMAQQKINRLT